MRLGTVTNQGISEVYGGGPGEASAALDYYGVDPLVDINMLEASSPTLSLFGG